MSRRLLAYTAVVAVVAVFGAGIWATGDEVDPEWLRFIGPAAIVVLGLLMLWEKVGWRWTWAQQWNLGPPDVRGTWQGRLESLWRDPATKAPPGGKEVYLVVRQTDSSLSVVLHTVEGRSESTLARASRSASGNDLAYIYVNTPSPEHEDHSRAHRGATWLRIIDQPAAKLDGRYWTDRDSRGMLTFERRSAHPADDFDGARALFDRRE